MKVRDVAKLQYEKGQQITVSQANAVLVQAYERFNDMGPSDVAPLSTGQFRVYDPAHGVLLAPAFLTNTQWYENNAAYGAVFDADSFRPSDAANYYALTLANGVANTPYGILTVGHRYSCYVSVRNSGALDGTFRVFNSVGNTTAICTVDLNAGATQSRCFSFVATSAYFSIGGKPDSPPGANTFDVDIVTVPVLGGNVIYLFDWDTNEFIIPNYCGFHHPATPTQMEFRAHHALISKAIRKEIETAQEVLKYL